MSSSLSISPISAASAATQAQALSAPASTTAKKPAAAAPPPPPPPPPATSTQLTEAQLVTEPQYELTQQAASGNLMAQQLLAQEKAANGATATTTATATATKSGSVNIIA